MPLGSACYGATELRQVFTLYTLCAGCAAPCHGGGVVEGYGRESDINTYPVVWVQGECLI